MKFTCIKNEKLSDVEKLYLKEIIAFNLHNYARTQLHCDRNIYMNGRKRSIALCFFKVKI